MILIVRSSPVLPMLRTLFAIVVLLALPALGRTQEGGIAFTPEEKAFIKAHPVISVSDVVWEPLAILENGRYQGVFHDYFQRVSEISGLGFRFTPIGDSVDFQNVLDALREKRIDCIDGTGKTRERREYALFAGPYFSFPLAIAARDGLKAASVTDLYGKRVAVARGSTASEYLKENHPDLPLVLVDDPRAALFMVSANQADAMLDNLAVVSFAIRKAGLANVRVTGKADYVFDVYALVRDDWPELASILEKARARISPEERGAILAKWMPGYAAGGLGAWAGEKD